MTAVEISNMATEQKVKAMVETMNKNSDAKEWFEKYASLVGNCGYTLDTFAGMFLAYWAK